ncbi:MAG: hypothetical protein MUF34_24185 [Polyangiaceae bacterium]|jgi:hypothetical protein|nr:hypothetical protein [Polyangiaceae bacterium]
MAERVRPPGAGREPRRRIYSEDLPLAEATRPEVLRPLAARGIELVLAVRPPTAGAALAALAEAAAAGVRVAVWPMLDDAEGRWANAWNASAYAAFASALLARFDAADAPYAELLVDLEPPVDAMRAFSHAPHRAVASLARRPREPDASARLVALVATAAARGVASSAAIAPMIAADGQGGWQRLLGTPVDVVPWNAIHAMAYTSLVEGYLPRLGRAGARSLLGATGLALRARYGPRAALSLGVVAPGALGDEAPYRDAAELADDVAIARACGVDDLALFDLRGALARPPLERWLDALVDTAPAASLPPLTRRASLATAAIFAAGHACARWPARRA